MATILDYFLVIIQGIKVIFLNINSRRSSLNGCFWNLIFSPKFTKIFCEVANSFAKYICSNGIQLRTSLKFKTYSMLRLTRTFFEHSSTTFSCVVYFGDDYKTAPQLIFHNIIFILLNINRSASYIDDSRINFFLAKVAKSLIPLSVRNFRGLNQVRSNRKYLLTSAF